MKSVGEAMAIGRNIHESLQKALASMETGLSGFDEVALDDDEAAITAALSKQTPDRLRNIAQALRMGMSEGRVQEITHFDPWFLARIGEIVEAEKRIKAEGLPDDPQALRALKIMGFTDARLADLTSQSEEQVRTHRHLHNIRPVFQRIDSVGGEFEALTPYMYSTYEAPFGIEPHDEADVSDRKKVVILGGGPNRIGQGIEFDYCCCHACFALAEAGYETIMINCNPETVSTDYDTSDRLYFEPLTAEHVMEILHKEMSAGELAGVIVQYGGQTPLKLAGQLEKAGIPILGTSPDAIDLAEDRERFQKLLQSEGLLQPENGIASSDEQAVEIDLLGIPAGVYFLKLERGSQHATKKIIIE